MIEVDFILMHPGNHETVLTKKMQNVPRVNDLVCLGTDVHFAGDTTAHQVHSVVWLIEPEDENARVMVYLKE